MDDEKSFLDKMSDAAKSAVETVKSAASSISDIAQAAADNATDTRVAATAIKLERNAEKTNVQVSTGDGDPIASTDAPAPNRSGRITPSYDDVLGPALLAGMSPVPLEDYAATWRIRASSCWRRIARVSTSSPGIVRESLSST